MTKQVTKQISEHEWLKKMVDHIPNDGIYKTKKIRRDHLFAKQGLTALEVHERYLMDVAWK